MIKLPLLLLCAVSLNNPYITAVPNCEMANSLQNSFATNMHWYALTARKNLASLC